MAQAEPSLYTSSTPISRAATNKAGCTEPSLFGGVTITRLSTPAIWAGIPFINTEETSGVDPSFPPGTYSPAASTGRTSLPVITPSSPVNIQESGSSRS